MTRVNVVTCRQPSWSSLAAAELSTLVLLLVGSSEAGRIASNTVIHISEWHSEGSVW